MIRKLITALLCLPLLLVSCQNTNSRSLQKGTIKIDLFTDKPVFKHIIHSSDTLSPAIGIGLAVNGEMKPWEAWKISSSMSGDTILYQMALSQPEIRAEFIYWIDSASVRMKIRNVSDPSGTLKEIGFQDQPWVTVADPAYQWWTVKNYTREPFVPKKVFSRGIGYYNTITGHAGDTVQQKGDLFFACIWHPEKFAVAVKTNTEIYPLRLWSDEKGCNLAPNKYYYRVKDKLMPDFEAQLAFISDLNTNGKIDRDDYFLWCNRGINDADELHRNAIFYKIKINDAGNRDNPSTNLAQTREMIDYIRNITDGIPQIIYLVGWQYDGHDTGYPAFDQLNPRMGTSEELYALSRYCDSMGSVLSIHCNMDDAYKGNKYFTPEIMGTDFDGTPIFWEIFADSAFHISHYKDVKTGSIFKRLEELFAAFPIHRSIHFDAMRVTNCNPEWEAEKIGVLEEYELGLKPIIHWFNDRGVQVTTETQNGNPFDLSQLVCGIWTNFWLTPEYRQIFHRKVVGGGIPEFMAPLQYTSGLGGSITQDFTYKPYKGHLDYQTNKVHMKEIIYLSSILYHFYLTKEMLEVNRDATNGYTARFSDDVVSTYDGPAGHLKVTWKDVIIAEGGERFVPVHGGIYAFSQNGADREWTLPTDFRGKNLTVWDLTATGKREFTSWSVSGNTIRLKLAAGQSVKIVAN
jgi:hypothetical protein